MQVDAQAPSLVWLFFSFKGRIARQSYFLSVLFLIFPQIFIVVRFIANENNESALAFWFLVLLVVVVCTLWSLAALAVKRLHDLGVTGWLALLILFPSLNWVFLLVLAVIPSKQEVNEHGSPPFPK